VPDALLPAPRRPGAPPLRPPGPTAASLSRPARASPLDRSAPLASEAASPASAEASLPPEAPGLPDTPAPAPGRPPRAEPDWPAAAAVLCLLVASRPLFAASRPSTPAAPPVKDEARSPPAPLRSPDPTPPVVSSLEDDASASLEPPPSVALAACAPRWVLDFPVCDFAEGLGDVAALLAALGSTAPSGVERALLFEGVAIEGSPDSDPIRWDLVAQPMSTAASSIGVSLRTAALAESLFRVEIWVAMCNRSPSDSQPVRDRNAGVDRTG